MRCPPNGDGHGRLVETILEVFGLAQQLRQLETTMRQNLRSAVVARDAQDCDLHSCPIARAMLFAPRKHQRVALSRRTSGFFVAKVERLAVESFL